MKRFWNHPWIVSVCNLVLIFVLYTINRLFFYWANSDIYPDVSCGHLMEMLVGGMRFDVTALFYLNSVYMLLMWAPLPWSCRTNATYQTVAKWFYWVPNIIGILVNSVDTVYVRFSDRRTTMAFFSEFENDDNLTSIFFTSMAQYWYVTLFTIALIAVLILLTRTPLNAQRPTLSSKRATLHYYLFETLLLCVSIYFVIIGIRSGFGAYTRPITLSNALQYTNRPCETNIVLNTPFCMMRSSSSDTYKNPDYFSDDELTQIYTPLHQPTEQGVPSKNIVVFILESFSKEYFGFYNHDLDNGNYTGYTPYLDSLICHSTTYQYSFSSGRKSIDAMPSVLASIPRFGAPYILTPYSNNTITSLANCLDSVGYTTAFFHGAPNGSMGFLAFSRSCGFKSYYGKNEYNNNADYDGYWAIWDEEFLQYMCGTINHMPQPFCASVFTATSHHPFQIPERYADTFDDGTHPIHRAIGYTDYAIRQFMEYAKNQPWYNNTLFVFTADHTNVLMHSEYTNDKGVYEVPIIFYDPACDTARYETNIPVAQVDIMPSILAYIGYNKPYIAFGEDVLTQSAEHKYVVNYNQPIYQCFSNHLLVQFDGQHITHIYDFQQDRLLQNDLLNELQSSAEVQDMLNYMKAYLQQYFNRMINNQLTAH